MLILLFPCTAHRHIHRDAEPISLVRPYAITGPCLVGDTSRPAILLLLQVRVCLCRGLQFQNHLHLLLPQLVQD